MFDVPFPDVAADDPMLDPLTYPITYVPSYVKAK